MPYNIVNFISVNQELDVGHGRQQGEDTRKNKEKKRRRKDERKKESSEVEQPQWAKKGVWG